MGIGGSEQSEQREIKMLRNGWNNKWNSLVSVKTF